MNVVGLIAASYAFFEGDGIGLWRDEFPSNYKLQPTERHDHGVGSPPESTCRYDRFEKTGVSLRMHLPNGSGDAEREIRKLNDVIDTGSKRPGSPRWLESHNRTSRDGPRISSGGGLIFQIVLLARDARSTRISVFLCEQEGEQRVSPSEWSVGRIRRFC